jgi:hypothetical protein
VISIIFYTKGNLKELIVLRKKNTLTVILYRFSARSVVFKAAIKSTLNDIPENSKVIIVLRIRFILHMIS